MADLDGEPGTITFMSSGEMSARMSPAHRAVLGRLTDPVRAIFLDTPAGFQENAAALAEKAVDYFTHNLTTPLSIVSFRSLAESTPAEVAGVAEKILAANYIFAGPGSPTYAVRNWIKTPVAAAFAERLRSGVHLAFASSAAISASRHVVPVYEIYKAGHDPYWVNGLDLLGAYGLEVAVMPHWNNSEGGTAFDTRYCFIGKRRLRQMEALLPETAMMVGIDENTACIFDLAAQQCKVLGAGRVILRRRGQEKTFGTGSTFGWQEFSIVG